MGSEYELYLDYDIKSEDFFFNFIKLIRLLMLNFFIKDWFLIVEFWGNIFRLIKVKDSMCMM